MTLTEYAERWLKLCANLKPRTVAGYREKLRLHILPSLGSLKIRRLHRAQIKDLLALKRESGLAVDSVRLIYATLRTMLTAAVEDSVIPANPRQVSSEACASRGPRARVRSGSGH